MTNLLLSVLFYASSTGGPNLKTHVTNCERKSLTFDTCTKTSSYKDAPIDYVCQKTGQHYSIAVAGTCTVTAETCSLAQQMARDCAVFSAHAAASAEIQQLDQGCQPDPVE